MKRLLYICPALIVFFVLAAFANLAKAQVANNTALVGTVLDSAGSAVVGAKVTAVEESTGVAYPRDNCRMAKATTGSSSFLRALLTSPSIRQALIR